MEHIHTTNAPAAIGPYSQAVKVGNFLYTSGQIALTPRGDFVGGDIERQTKQVLENLRAVLQEAGSDFDRVIKTTVFLADMDDFLKMNRVYSQYFGEHKPARSTVAVKTLPGNALVEIECIALIQKEQDYSF